MLKGSFAGLRVKIMVYSIYNSYAVLHWIVSGKVKAQSGCV